MKNKSNKTSLSYKNYTFSIDIQIKKNKKEQELYNLISLTELQTKHLTILHPLIGKLF